MVWIAVVRFAEVREMQWEDIFGDGLQAVATLVAVLVGFGLSLLAQRAERRHQNRIEAQTRLLNAIAELVESLELARTEARHVVGIAVAPSDDVPGIDALRAHDRVASVRAVGERTDSALAAFRVDAARLRLFAEKPPAALKVAVDSTSAVRQALGDIAKEVPTTPETALEELAAAASKLSADLDALLPGLEELARDDE